GWSRSRSTPRAGAAGTSAIRLACERSTPGRRRGWWRRQDAMPPLRVGVVGCGGIAQMMHLPTLAERPDLFRVTALAGLSEKTLTTVGERYGVSARLRDGRELAARSDVAAVLLFASGCHRDAVLDLLAAGKPIFVEKPLAFSLPETEEVARAVREAGVPFM